MKALMKFLFCILLFVPVIVCEGAFGSAEKEKLVPISIGVIKAYGNYTLKDNLFASFQDQFREKLQYGKQFRLNEKFNGSVMIKGHNVPVDDFFSVLLMDAIVNGNEYSYEYAGPTLKQFAKARGVTPKTTKRKLYQLSPDYFNILRTIRQNSDSKYLLLCNLKSAGLNYYAGMEVDYYLINLDKNEVFEGHVYASKNSSTFSYFFVGAKYGERSGTELFQKLSEKISETIANDIDEEAIPALRHMENSND